MTRGFEHFTAADAAQLGKQPGKAVRTPQKPRSKYGSVPTTVDGVTFHSAAEARRYGELKLLEQAGEITYLGRQPVFMLYAPGVELGTSVPLGRYIADFSYMTPAGEVVEDVKGGPIPAFSRWKIKHCEAQYGLKVRIIR